MSATQEVFLYMFYGDKKYFLKSEIADFLKMSRTSLTRDSEELTEKALKTEESALAECSMMNPPKIP